MTQMMIKSPGGVPYVTTAKDIQGEAADYQSYDKTPMFLGADGDYCTFACFLRVPHITSNTEGFIYGNSVVNFYTRNWGYGAPNLNEFVIRLYDTGYDGYLGITQNRTVHGIDVGDWFAFMVSADLSGSAGDVQVYIQKVGESAASDISVISPLEDDPLTGGMGFSSEDTPAVVNSNPWFLAQSLDSDLCEFYFTDEQVDWSDQNVRDLFIDANGKPVGLGAGGINLTGTAAKIYAPDGDLSNNQGTAGNFSEENGPIINASTSPTD